MCHPEGVKAMYYTTFRKILCFIGSEYAEGRASIDLYGFIDYKDHLIILYIAFGVLYYA